MLQFIRPDVVSFGLEERPEGLHELGLGEAEGHLLHEAEPGSDSRDVCWPGEVLYGRERLITWPDSVLLNKEADIFKFSFFPIKF